MGNFAVLNFKFYNTAAGIRGAADEVLRKIDGKDSKSILENGTPEERKMLEEKYPNVDFSRTLKNKIIVGDMDYYNAYRDALKSDYYTKADNRGRYHQKPKNNDDTIKMIGIVATYSKNAETAKIDEEKWINENIKFLQEMFPGCPMNICAHYDENDGLHLQGSVIPVITEKTPQRENKAQKPRNQIGKISSRTFIKSSIELSKIQTQYAERMEKFGLERGKCRCEKEKARMRENKTIGQRLKEIIKSTSKDEMYQNVKVKKRGGKAVVELPQEDYENLFFRAKLSKEKLDIIEENKSLTERNTALELQQLQNKQSILNLANKIESLSPGNDKTDDDKTDLDILIENATKPKEIDKITKEITEDFQKVSPEIQQKICKALKNIRDQVQSLIKSDIKQTIQKNNYHNLER